MNGIFGGPGNRMSAVIHELDNTDAKIYSQPPMENISSNRQKKA